MAHRSHHRDVRYIVGTIVSFHSFRTEIANQWFVSLLAIVLLRAPRKSTIHGEPTEIHFTVSFSAVRVYSVSLNYRRFHKVYVATLILHRRAPFANNSTGLRETPRGKEEGRIDSRYFALFPRE